MHTEQRNFPRIKISLETVYYCETPDDAPGQACVYYPGTVTDSSRYGLGLLVHHPHRPLEQLWFRGICHDREAITGLVQWVSSQDQDLYQVGVRLFHPAS